MHWNVNIGHENHIVETILCVAGFVLMFGMLIGAFLLSSHP